MQRSLDFRRGRGRGLDEIEREAVAIAVGHGALHVLLEPISDVIRVTAMSTGLAPSEPLREGVHRGSVEARIRVAVFGGPIFVVGAARFVGSATDPRRGTVQRHQTQGTLGQFFFA